MDRTNPSAAERLTALIRQRTARIGIIGLGYVGLPLAKAMLDGGYKVIGFDLDPNKIDMLNSGRTYIRHLPTDMFEGARVRDGFLATADLGMLGEPDVILICVPTPLTKHREPDLTFVEKTALAIKSHLRQGQLIILKMTSVSRNNSRRHQAYSREIRTRLRQRFFSHFQPRARGSRQSEFFDKGHTKSRRRRKSGRLVACHSTLRKCRSAHRARVNP